MFFTTLTQAGHTRSFTVRAHLADGWELRVEENNRLVRHSRYTDWYRLERALLALQSEVQALKREGWQAPGAACGQSMNR